MTTQKSPESIADDIVNICGVPIGNDRSNLIYSISQAIKAERESNRLVLPERKIMNFEWGHEHENSSTFGFNRCLDEVTRLNPDLVSQNEEKKI